MTAVINLGHQGRTRQGKQYLAVARVADEKSNAEAKKSQHNDHTQAQRRHRQWPCSSLDNLPRRIRLASPRPKNAGASSSIRTSAHTRVTRQSILLRHAHPEFDPAAILGAFALNELLRTVRGDSGSVSGSVMHLADRGRSPQQPSPAFSQSRRGRFSKKTSPQGAYEFATHGTQVAALSLGGLELALANSLVLPKKNLIQMHNIVASAREGLGTEVCRRRAAN